MIKQSPHAQPSAQILQEAATWLMEMHDGPLSPTARMRFNQWRGRSAEHELAWQKAAMLRHKFQGVSAPGAAALKNTPASSRRTAIKTLVVLLAAGPVVWGAYRWSPLAGQEGRLVTAKGERRNLVLEDGTRITMNTATEIQVRFDARWRHIRLLQGEILVATAQDRQHPARPFIVQTDEGSLRPLGTRFTVRQLDGRSQVAVYEGAVEVTPAEAPRERKVVEAGHQAGFSPSGIDATGTCDELGLSWMNGMLVADRMPLAMFAGELGRYRTGLLQVDAGVAALPVSGVFPLGDTGASLTLLEQTMPVRIQYFTRYLARIVPK